MKHPEKEHEGRLNALCAEGDRALSVIEGEAEEEFFSILRMQTHGPAATDELKRAIAKKPFVDDEVRWLSEGELGRRLRAVLS